jgi:hypothetical protein
MAAKIKIIRSVDYLDISDSGIINFSESRKRLRKIAREDPTTDYDLLLDFRRTQWVVSSDEIFDLVEVLLGDMDSFKNKVGFLLLPGVNFDREHFNELCSDYPGIPLRTFTNYEDAIEWVYNS